MSGGGDDEEEIILNEPPSKKEQIINWFKDLQLHERILLIVFGILLVIFVIVATVRLVQVLKLSVQKKHTQEKFTKVENKIAKIEKRLGVESYHAKKHQEIVSTEKQLPKDIFTKQTSKKEIIKEVIPDVAEVGLNIAEHFNLIDLANKNLMNQIIRKSSGH